MDALNATLFCFKKEEIEGQIRVLAVFHPTVFLKVAPNQIKKIIKYV